MKYLILLLSFTTITFFSSCSDDNGAKSNSWRLTETLLDPGDGSGTFQPIESEFYVSLLDDGTYKTINGSFCTGDSNNPGVESTGTYNEETLKIKPANCEILDRELSYTIDGNELIVNLFCIEACRLKFTRLLAD